MQDVVNVQYTLDESTYQKYKALNVDIEPLEDRAEVERIAEYIEKSKSHHHYGAFRGLIRYWKVRCGADHDRFNPDGIEEMELFHGTRTANFIGILRSGLLIAPTSAPCTGYAFGKGIYFADQSTKSINYSNFTPRGKSTFLILCDVALGKKYLVNKSTFFTEAPRGYDSVFAKKDHCSSWVGNLLHNEYIVYNTNQSRLKYIVEYTR